jgi:hypothetical protein
LPPMTCTAPNWSSRRIARGSLLRFPSVRSRRSDFLPSLPVTYVLRSRYHALLRP